MFCKIVIFSLQPTKPMPETASFRPDYDASADFFPPPNFGEGAEGRRDLSVLPRLLSLSFLSFLSPLQEKQGKQEKQEKQPQKSHGYLFRYPRIYRSYRTYGSLLKVVANNVVGILVPAIGSFVSLHRLGRNIDCRQFYTVATKSSPISIW